MTTVEKIFDLIVKSGKSEYHLKKEIQLPNSTFSEWRAGRAKPSADALLKIADYFNVSVDYLLGRDDIKKEPTEKSIDSIIERLAQKGITPERLAKLSDNEKNTLVNLIKAFLDGIA